MAFFGWTYLAVLSLSSLLFLLQRRVIELRHLWEVYDDDFDPAKSGVEIAVRVVVFIWDFLRDTAKYILIALTIAAVSLAVYVSVFRRPARWKCRSLFILGVAMNWVGIMPPDELAEALKDDRYHVVLSTIVGIGVLYVSTAAWQLVHTERTSIATSRRSGRQRRTRNLLRLKGRMTSIGASSLLLNLT